MSQPISPTFPFYPERRTRSMAYLLLLFLLLKWIARCQVVGARAVADRKDQSRAYALSVR
jgi:hypothetical protein